MPYMPKLKIEEQSILLVEGNDEVKFFQKMLKHMRIGKVQCIDAGGKDHFKERFLVLSKDSEFENIRRIAFIRDAEQFLAQDALKSIKSCVDNARVGFSIDEITKDNIITCSKDVKCGVYIMPDNYNKGMLENLLIEYFKTEPYWACVDNYISCLEESGINFRNKAKSAVLACLASKDECYRIGIAAEKGYIDFDNTVFNNIKNFLSNMFQ